MDVQKNAQKMRKDAKTTRSQRDLVVFAIIEKKRPKKEKEKKLHNKNVKLRHNKVAREQTMS